MLQQKLNTLLHSIQYTFPKGTYNTTLPTIKPNWAWDCQPKRQTTSTRYFWPPPFQQPQEIFARTVKAKHCSAVSIPHFRSFQQLPPTISRTWYQKHNLSQVADAELDLRAKSVFNTILPFKISRTYILTAQPLAERADVWICFPLALQLTIVRNVICLGMPLESFMFWSWSDGSCSDHRRIMVESIFLSGSYWRCFFSNPDQWRSGSFFRGRCSFWCTVGVRSQEATKPWQGGVCEAWRFCCYFILP